MSEDMRMILSKLDEVSKQIGGLRAEVYEQIDGLRKETGGLREDIQKTRLLLEQDISKKIDVIGEGHDFLKNRLENAMRLERDRERMDLELINLRIEVRKIQERLDQIA